MSNDPGAFDALLDEQRRFPPSEAFKANAVISDPGIYERAAADRDLDTAVLRRSLDAFRSDRTRSAHIAEARRLLPILRGLETAIEGPGADEAARRIARRAGCPEAG